MSDAVLSVSEMRAAEQAAIESGTSEWSLMKRAGEGAAQWIMRVAAGRGVTVMCGPGNNGGDGYVIAQLLKRAGLAVQVIAPAQPKSECAIRARSEFDGDVAQDALPAHPVVVDCLFGYGLARNLEGAFADLLEFLVTNDCFKIAIDVPSSVKSDTGETLGPLPYYDLTLALGAWKHAHGMMPARASMGAMRLVSLGLDLRGNDASFSTRPDFSPPAAKDHKYSRGLLAVVAGEMPGAPLLAAEAAMRAGAGYVKLLSDHSHPDAPAELVIEQAEFADAIVDDRIKAFLVGPGLGRGDDARSRLAEVLRQRKPAVLDADALHLLDPELLKTGDPSKLSLTPHEGELAKLCDTFGIEAVGKLDRARALQDATGTTVLAKGPDTILVSADGTRFFPRGTSWLSVAGTGDVLAGVVASRLAVGGDPASACEEGVWLHQEAARIASPAFTAGELAKAVRPAMASFL